MARPGLLVDSVGLVAIANEKDRFHRATLAILAEFFGDLITTWPAVTEACHIVPAHLNAALVDGTVRILTIDKADFDIYRTKTGRRLEVLP